MKKIMTVGFLLLNCFGTIDAGELIEVNQALIEQLKAMEYEPYDSGYAEWQATDIELFSSKDENFSMGVWKAEAGQEIMDTPYPYNTWMLIKEGEIETINSNGEKNIYKEGEGFITPKGWTGTFAITKDLVIIYIYDGLDDTENGESMDLNKVSAKNYNRNDILTTLGQKEFLGEAGDLILTKEELSFTNKDESFQIGLWEGTEGEIPASWNYDEFMYVLRGSIEMTDTAGKTVIINANEGVMVPTGWEGVFSVQETVAKIWIIYDD